MKVDILKRLRFVLPLLVIVFFLCVSLIILTLHYIENKNIFIENAVTSLKIEMYRLSNSLSDLYGLNKPGLAERQFTEMLLDPQFRKLLLVDDKGIVLFSNKRLQIGNSVNEILDFDPGVGKKIISAEIGFVKKIENNEIIGYFPVKLGILYGEIRNERKGSLFFVYNVSEKLKSAMFKSLKEAVILFFMGLFFAFILAYVLFIKITRKVEIINKAMSQFSIGANTERLAIKGGDEISLIATSFNQMAEKLQKADEQKRFSEKVLKASEEKFRVMFEQVSVSKVMAGTDGSILLVNTAFCKLLGYSVDEVRMRKFIDFTHPDDIEKSLDAAVQLLDGSMTSYRMEKRYLHRNSSVIWAVVDITLIRDDNSDPHYFITSIADITERKRFEAELIEARKVAEENSKLKTAFLQNISHEIRTPLNAIIGFSDLLQTRCLSDENKLKYTSIIKNSGTQLLNIITDILTISSLETNQEKFYSEPVKVNDVLTDCFHIFQSFLKGKHVELRLNIKSPVDFIIYTDITKLTQILNNLLENSAKFTSKGYIEIGNYLTSDEIVFFVKDTGIGIPEEKHEVIFQRFLQADSTIHHKYGGTGLGLSIAKAFVEMMGGRIWLKSSENKGSEFYFALPVKNEIEALFDKNKVDRTQGKVLVLIAEDSEDNYDLLVEMLSDYNMQFLHAINGTEAVELFKANQNIELVLMDIRMPEMDGFEAARQIKNINRKVPVVAQTAYVLNEELENNGDLFDEFVVKPISGNDLFQIIKKYLV